MKRTAFDIFDLDGVEQLCGDHVRWLGIVRHPLDVAVSCVDFCDAAGMYPAPLHRYIARYSHPIEAFVRSWVDATEALIDLGTRRTDQVAITRYEDLVDDPADTVAALLEHLELEPTTSFLDGALEGMENLGFSDHKSYQHTQVHGDSIARWESVPSATIERVAPLVNPLLDMLGYDALPEDAGPDLAESRARYARSLAIHAAKRSD